MAMVPAAVMPTMDSASLDGHIMNKAFCENVVSIHEQVSLPSTTSKYELQQRVWAIYVAAVDITVPDFGSEYRATDHRVNTEYAAFHLGGTHRGP